MSGLSESGAQSERLKRQIQRWKHLQNPNSYILSLGDANLNALKWDEDNFEFKEMANQVREYLADTSSFQIINEETRIENSKDASSCIDHCYTNVPEKILEAELVGVGGSDHLGLVIKKLAIFPVSRPQKVRRRCYKNFDITSFLKTF